MVNSITFFRGILAFLIAVTCLKAGGANVELISRTTNPSITGFGISGASSLSADGRYVLFMSSANNLASNDSQALHLDLFLRDLQNNKTQLVSVSTNGHGGGNGDSLTGQISTNGQWVVFESLASNLATNDFNETYDVFLRNLATGETELISRDPSGDAAVQGGTNPLMSEDGKVVVFLSEDRDFGPLGTHDIANIWARDTANGTLEQVNVDLNLPANATNKVSGNISMTPDGRYVVFETSYRKGTEWHSDVFVRDLQIKLTKLISGDKTNLYYARANTRDIPQAFHPIISSTGEHVFWKIKGSAGSPVAWLFRGDMESRAASFLGTNDAVGVDLNLSINNAGTLAVFPRGKDILLWNEETGVTNFVNTVANGTAISSGIASTPVISGDGNWIAFMSNAEDLVTNVVHAEFQWYLKNRLTGETKLLSQNPEGEGAGGVDISSISISDNGAVVVFDGESGEIVASDLNRAMDVFVASEAAAEVNLISEIDPAIPNSTGYGASELLGMTADGRYILFSSYADYLTQNDFNDMKDIFLRDTQSGTTALVSVSPDGVTSGDRSSTKATMSADGRYIAFSSIAAMTPADTNSVEDIFLRDMQTGNTTLISSNADGTAAGNQASFNPQISADGSWVLFESSANNFGFTDLNQNTDIFLRDVRAGKTHLVSSKFGQPTAAGRSASSQAVLSSDGKWVAFRSSATDLLQGGNPAGASFLRRVPEGPTRILFTNAFDARNPMVFSPDSRYLAASQYTNSTRSARFEILEVESLTSSLTCHGCEGPVFDPGANFVAFNQRIPDAEEPQLVLYELQNGKTNIISAGSGMEEFADAPASSVALSEGAERIVFTTTATNLLPQDHSGGTDVYLWARNTGQLTALTTTAFFLEFQALKQAVLITPDGSNVVFESSSVDLVPGDYNLEMDVFRLDLEPLPEPLQVHLTAVPNGSIQFQWGTLPGTSYQVQARDDLMSNTWTPVGSEVMGDGTTKTFSEPISGVTSRFYRVEQRNR